MRWTGLVALISVVTFATGCTQTVGEEPGPGKLGHGVKVFVDDGSCPAGQIKQVTGGNNAQGIARKRECVAKPA